MDFTPNTLLGRWSVWLNAIFVTVIATSIFLVKVLGVLSFDALWWDVTVNVFLASIAAFIVGIIAIRKKDSSVLLYASVMIGLLAILFLLLHSLFISD